MKKITVVLKKVLQFLYFFAWICGNILYVVARLQLALAYCMMSEFTKSKDILKSLWPL